MFVLRRITSQGVTSNTVIGESYILIDSERNPKRYKESLNILINPKREVSQPVDIIDEGKDIYGFVSYNEGSKLIPLYKKSTYFIMMCNGRTFENISVR